MRLQEREQVVTAAPVHAPVAGDLNVVHAAELHAVTDGGAARRGAEQAETTCIRDGAVAIRSGIIRAVGRSEDVLAEWGDGAPTIDADGQVVVPGLVEAHAHPVFVGDRADEYVDRLAGRRAGMVTGDGDGDGDGIHGIHGTVACTRSASDAELADGLRSVFAALLASGVTTVEAKTGYGLQLSEELRHLRLIDEARSESLIDVVATFLGGHMTPAELRPDDYIALVEREMLPAVVEQGIACFNDVTCEAEVFDPAQCRRMMAAAQRLGLPNKVHADAFADSGGWRLAIEERAVSADHLTFTPDDDIADAGSCDTVAVLLPVAELMYRCERRASARLLRDCGVPLAIATDYCASLGVVAALTGLVLAAPWFGLTPGEVLVGATLNAAYALGVAGSCGSLDAGKRGDLVFLRGPRLASAFWRMGGGEPTRVVKSGVVVG